MFHALQDVIDQDTQRVYQSRLIPKSDQIMYKVTGKDRKASTLDLIFKRDSGRRNCNPVGTDQIRDCLSATFISKDLVLLNLLNLGASNSWSSKESYWTFVTIDGEIKTISKELLSILEIDNFYFKVQSRIIRGDVCQLLLSKQSWSGDFDDDEDNIVKHHN